MFLCSFLVFDLTWLMGTQLSFASHKLLLLAFPIAGIVLMLLDSQCHQLVLLRYEHSCDQAKKSPKDVLERLFLTRPSSIVSLIVPLLHCYLPSECRHNARVLDIYNRNVNGSDGGKLLRVANVFFIAAERRYPLFLRLSEYHEIHDAVRHAIVGRLG